MKKFLEYVMFSWLFGGGFCVSLLCLVFSWKIALCVLCFWMITVIVGALVAINRNG